MPDVLGRFRLDGAVALVTGAASGIGRATAAALAEAGATVAVTDKDGDAAAEAAAAIGGTAFSAALDIADEERIGAVIGGVAERHGRLDVLVNNASIGAHQT